MKYHILNGDALKEQFPVDRIDGDLIIVRECLLEGDVSGDDLETFRNNRAAFIQKEYGASREEYFDKTVSEFELIFKIPEGAEINLWFEDDLFCQVNLWFVIFLLDMGNKSNDVFLVRPQEDKLIAAYDNKILLTGPDRENLKQCWGFYKKNDLTRLKKISHKLTAKLPHLDEVIQAHIDRFPENGELGRPEKSLLEIMKDMKENNNAGFEIIFREFTKREGIYGFGDLQVKSLYEKVIKYC